MEVANSPTPNDWSIIGSSLIGTSGVYEDPNTVNDYVVNDDRHSLSLRQSGRNIRPFNLSFDNGEYERLILMMIVKNNLPFALVESESFRDLISFLRQDTPNKSCSALTSRLEEMYGNEFEKLKKTLDENIGKFSITVDKTRCGDNLDFLRVILHFYNNDYELQNYVIGIEPKIGKGRFTGKMVYEFVKRVLIKHGIERRIVSITRNNTRSMTFMMKEFMKESNVNGIKIDGDVRCVKHALSLSAEELLSYTFFKKNDSLKLESSIDALVKENPSFQDFARRMKHLPRIMRVIILQLNYKQNMKHRFKVFVEGKMAGECSRTSLEDMFTNNDTPWLSTYHMIDRFIHFRAEITLVLMLHYGAFSESAADLEKFQLTTRDWDYLINVRNILKVFVHSTLKLQGSPYPTINLTIPVIQHISLQLKSLKAKNDLAENPFIDFGLEEARKKLLAFYPLHEEEINSNKMFYLAIVLDPRYKLAVFKDVGFSAEKINSIKKLFVRLFNEYETRFKDDLDKGPVKPEISSPKQPKTGGFFFVDEEDEREENEVEKYLEEPREGGSQDIIAFYKIQKTRFPVISNMARDYFSVSAISSPSEASREENRVTKRGGISSSSIQMLEILKSRGIITAEEMSDEDMDGEEGEKMGYPEFIDVDQETDESELMLSEETGVGYDEVGLETETHMFQV